MSISLTTNSNQSPLELYDNAVANIFSARTFAEYAKEQSVEFPELFHGEAPKKWANNQKTPFQERDENPKQNSSSPTKSKTQSQFDWEALEKGKTMFGARTYGKDLPQGTLIRAYVTAIDLKKEKGKSIIEFELGYRAGDEILVAGSQTPRTVKLYQEIKNGGENQLWGPVMDKLNSIDGFEGYLKAENGQPILLNGKPMMIVMKSAPATDTNSWGALWFSGMD